MAVHLVLQGLDLLPRLQTAAHRAQIKRLDKEGRLVHLQNDFTGDLLVAEDLAVLLLDTHGKKVLGNIVGAPCLDFAASVQTILLFISLLALDVRHAVVQVGTVLAARVRGGVKVRAVTTGWRPQIGNVFVNDVERFVKNLAVMARY